MSYRYTSNQTADQSQLLVLYDLVARGYIPSMPYSRDSIYDLVVDRGGVFQTVQVKTLQGNILHTSNRGLNVDEPVSRHGKQRNRYFYRDYNIDWLVGVSKTPPQQLFYYPLNIYRDFEDINVLRVRAFDFGRCAVCTNHRNKTMIMPVLASDRISLSGFDLLETGLVPSRNDEGRDGQG